MANAFRKSPAAKMLAVSTPLPVPKINLFKLDEIGEIMGSIDGKKTSELSDKEKMVVEMFFRRAYCDKNGKLFKIDDYDSIANEAFKILVPHSWTTPFLLGAYQNAMDPMKQRVYEDEPVNFLDLQRGSFTPTGSPMFDALNSWPDNYYPIRLYKNKRCATFHCRSSVNYKKGDAKYAERDSFFATREASINATPLMPKENFIAESLKRGWSTLSEDLKRDVILGLKFPDRFAEHFDTKFNLLELDIPAEEKADIEYFLKAGDGFRLALDQ